MRLLILPVLLALSCGPPVVIEKVPAETPKVPSVDYSAQGHPVSLGEELEVKGLDPLWVKGTELLVQVKSTKWDQIGNTRDGRATFWIKLGEKERTTTISEGREKVVFGYKFSVALAYEFYNSERATYVPHVKFTISQQ